MGKALGQVIGLLILIVIVALYFRIKNRINKSTLTKVLVFKDEIITKTGWGKLSFPVIISGGQYVEYSFIENIDERWNDYAVQKTGATDITDSKGDCFIIEEVDTKKIGFMSLPGISTLEVISTNGIESFDTTKQSIYEQVSTTKDSVYKGLEKAILKSSNMQELIVTLKKGNY